MESGGNLESSDAATGDDLEHDDEIDHEAGAEERCIGETSHVDDSHLKAEYATVKSRLPNKERDASEPERALAMLEPQKSRVVVVDTDPAALDFAASALTHSGCECDGFTSPDAAAAAIERRGAEVVIASLHGSGADANDLLRRIHGRRPELPVIVVAEDPSTGAAVKAMRQGAFDYLVKPFDSEELAATVARAVQLGSLQRENKLLREQLNVANYAADFVAESRQSKQLVAMLRRVAPARSTALIEGESGTGKELVARLLHHWSKRADGPFVAVNCKSFADGVVESELFGHEKGSFTGAIAARAGCFERASGGTLFLDEIGEAGPDFQAKLLRVLEDREVLRVGASKPRKVDVRIIAASNRVLQKEVAAGRFRADLYFRLNVIALKLAPLRERPDDILPLARHFLASHSLEAGRPLNISPEGQKLLLSYGWPGNVRELENVIERAVVMSGADFLTAEAFALDGGIIEAESDAEEFGDFMPSASGSLQEYLDRATAERIKVALRANGGNRAGAATELGIDRTTLYRLMKRLGL